MTLRNGHPEWTASEQQRLCGLPTGETRPSLAGRPERVWRIRAPDAQAIREAA